MLRCRELYRTTSIATANTLARLLSECGPYRWYAQLRRVAGSSGGEWHIVTTDEDTNRDPVVQQVTTWEAGRRLPLEDKP